MPVRAALEGTVYSGPGAVEEWFVALDESWEALTGEIQGSRDGGDWVVGFARLRGRGRGSGAAIDIEGASVAHFRDGLIRRLQNFTNRADALKAVGLQQ